MKVVVVGAGAAGLAATHTLRKNGISVSTIERENRVGGRVCSASEDGYIMDLGTQFLGREHSETTIGLLEEIGLDGDIVRNRISVRLWNDGRLYTLELSPNPRVLLRDLEYFLRGYSPRGLLGLVRLMAYIARRHRDFGTDRDHHLWDLDAESVADLAVRVSDVEVLENFVQPVLSGLILTDPEQIGAILGLVCVRMSLTGLAAGLLTMKNGFGCIAKRIHNRYEDSFLTSAEATRVAIEKGRVKGVETDRGLIEADAVICATTATAALKLMPDLPDSLFKPLEKARYSSCCHVIFGVRESPFTEGEFAVYLPRRSGSPIAFIGSGRAKSCGMVPGRGDLVHCFIYGKHAVELNSMSDEKVIRIIGDEARRYLPDLSDRPLFSKVCRFDEAVYTAPPGALSALENARKGSLHDVKGLYLAGEYLGVGGVESAVRSGVDAAEDVLLLTQE